MSMCGLLARWPPASFGIRQRPTRSVRFRRWAVAQDGVACGERYQEGSQKGQDRRHSPSQVVANDPRDAEEWQERRGAGDPLEL